MNENNNVKRQPYCNSKFENIILKNLKAAVIIFTGNDKFETIEVL
jgi:hypothetical protein